MPGQRKRKRHQQQEAAHHAAPHPPGRWEPLFSTHDQAELQSYLRRMYAENQVTDPTHVRLDTFCGRLIHPTSYQVSVFVPEGT